MGLKRNEKINIPELVHDLDKYHPRRRGWTWRKKMKLLKMGDFTYHDHSESLKNSIALPAAKHFGGIDPQPGPVITTEIASGRFEDDIRRMRMAAWHGADHIMVIRTMGQSHFDRLIEGTPEGVGGVPITRKQIRASRKACDMIEDEIGRSINFHSYISGVAGPEIAVMFAEEGVNGAHQDPQYNVLYRNINMYRSFTDAAEAKSIMTWGDIFQIDGAHNANATAKKAWKVMPELMVQHAINCMFSVKIGMKKDNIGLSTVPPTSTPGPKFYYDFPYAVALRDLFNDYKMRAQQNTRYVESDSDEATITHVIDMLISALTRVDIQSTITPDEGRNVPWHYNNIKAVDAAKQTFNALDGIKQMLEIKKDGIVPGQVTELKQRAILFMEEILDSGGYFEAVERGIFVDSGYYPERCGDGIAREKGGGIAAASIVKRETDYFAPVCAHFGHNHLPVGIHSACDASGGCTLCKPEKIAYIDELDEEDNCEKRLQNLIRDRKDHIVRPEVQWHGDGIVVLQMFIPIDAEKAPYAALELAKQMGLHNPEVINMIVQHPAEGTYLEVKGRSEAFIKESELIIPPREVVLEVEEIRSVVEQHHLKVVGGTVGEDEHSVGMQEIMNIKHGGLEKFGFDCHYLGTSVSLTKLVDAAIEIGAKVICASTIISHGDIHRLNMRKLHQICVEKGIRQKVLLIAGGTQVTDQIARSEGMDAGFGRGTKGHEVGSFIVKQLRERKLV